MNTPPPTRAERLERRLLCSGFAPPVGYDSFEAAHAAALDYDLDGMTDLAVISSGGALRLFHGAPGGLLESMPPVHLGGNLEEVVADDFTGDGRADLVVLTRSQVQLLAGSGNGTFAAPVPIGSAANCVLTADFNADGRPDLAFPSDEVPSGSEDPWPLAVRLGNGDGTFGGPVPVPSTASAFNAAAADFNGDGRLDLAVERGLKDLSLAVHVGNGDGTFADGPPLSSHTYRLPAPSFVDDAELVGRLIATGDFNGDGRADLAAAVEKGFRLFTGRGDGTFNRPILHKRRRPFDLAAGDFNGDGLTDLVTTANWSKTRNSFAFGLSWRLLVYSGAPAGRMRTTHKLGATPVDRIVTADLNADGRSDLVLVRRADDKLRIILATAP
jgi:hypothetical protein